MCVSLYECYMYTATIHVTTITPIHSSEVSSSNHNMEKEDLHCVLQFLKKEDLKVGILDTDRHQHITKWIREQHPNVKYYFDIWHVAKDVCMCSLA